MDLEITEEEGGISKRNMQEVAAMRAVARKVLGQESQNKGALVQLVRKN